jgi:hypothetical protein
LLKFEKDNCLDDVSNNNNNKNNKHTGDQRIDRLVKYSRDYIDKFKNLSQENFANIRNIYEGKKVVIEEDALDEKK